jgi:S-formylglutathione hydrolase
MAELKILKTHKTFGGLTQFWEHESRATQTKMKFSTFRPAGEIRGCVIWLSGLTCTDENFITKAGSQGVLAQHQLMVICPDTSPRGLGLPHEHDSWDFGSGAGFYVDATTDGYRDHYRMFSYVSQELYALIQSEFKIKDRISIMGHSMGGHGALVLGLREPQKFKAVSAFAPIVKPMNCPWGEKAFLGYLGADRDAWKAYDTCELLKSGSTHPSPILIHQGTKDEFLEKQLLTANFLEAAKLAGQKHVVELAEDYDHSYYFIATYIESHIRHHARFLMK